MGKGDGERHRGGLTPEHEAERFSTGGLDFKESLRRVVAGGPDPEHSGGETDMGEHSGVAERDLTDEELTAVWETTVAGVRDGTIPTFSDKEAFLADARRRFRL